MRLLKRLPRETARDYAFRMIKDNIIRLELEPGSLISENELAGELGLSRTPVREALIALAKSKVVEITPQKRTIVAPIDENLVEEARFLRNVLECAVVELACEMATEADLIHLEENVKIQQTYMTNGPRESMIELDNQFHKYLFTITEKQQIFDVLQNTVIHFDRIRNLVLNGSHDMELVEDHRLILEAIRDRDAARAKAMMELHLSRVKVDSVSIREQFPQYFKPVVHKD